MQVKNVKKKFFQVQLFGCLYSSNIIKIRLDAALFLQLLKKICKKLKYNYIKRYSWSILCFYESHMIRNWLLSNLDFSHGFFISVNFQFYFIRSFNGTLLQYLFRRNHFYLCTASALSDILQLIQDVETQNCQYPNLQPYKGQQMVNRNLTVFSWFYCIHYLLKSYSHVTRTYDISYCHCSIIRP